MQPMQEDVQKSTTTTVPRSALWSRGALFNQWVAPASDGMLPSIGNVLSGWSVGRGASGVASTPRKYAIIKRSMGTQCVEWGLEEADSNRHDAVVGTHRLPLVQRRGGCGPKPFISHQAPRASLCRYRPGTVTADAIIDTPQPDLPIVTGSPGDALSFDVAILGGGASGILVAIHLLHGGDRPLRIAIVEPRGALAQGVAYSTELPEHLLNVISSRMSAFDDDPEHLIRFLSEAAGQDGADPQQNTRSRFIPRSLFSRYLRATFEHMPGVENVQWVQDEAVDLEPGSRTRICLRSGAALEARCAVLALGNEPRAIPAPVSPGVVERITNAWDYAAVRGIDPDHDVCIIGSGLSMVDSVATLARNKHRGRITVLSRHGLLPLPHATPGSQEGDIGDLLAFGMRARLRTLRKRARAAMRAGQPWQWTMDALRHHGQSLWQASSDAECRRFLRHGARFWDIHRHRIAPQVAAQLDALRAAGQLAVRSGRLAGIDQRDGAILVRYRRRGERQDAALAAGHVINATGIETSLARSERPLLRALLARGVLQPGPFGLGIATHHEGSIIDGTGRVQPALMTLGSARIGELWESVAIPELRVQARQIAGALRHLNVGSP